MAISAAGEAPPNIGFGIRLLTIAGFALLVGIIVASNTANLFVFHQFDQSLGQLQRLHAASELAADIDRRMTALRLSASDLAAAGATDATQPLALAADLSTLLTRS